MPRTLTFPFTAILGAALALALGCGAERATAPTGPAAPAASAVVPTAGTARHAAGPAEPTPLAACTRRPESSDTEVIGRHGGTLRFGGNSLAIPAGALEHPVRITARVVPHLDHLLVEFEPSGLHFARPATLSLNTAGCAIPRGSEPQVVYVGHDGRIVERIDSAFSRWWQRIAAPIRHFSGYSIAL